MQVIIKDVLESKKQLTTDEFISALSAKGVGVLFNPASTGYVSGISFTYQGIVMQGSRLGNGFKWSTAKNIINYEQESDRQRIHETNVRSEHAINKLQQVTNMLKQIEQPHRAVLNDMESFRIKHRTLSYSFTDHHSQLKSSEQQLQRLTEKLSNQLTELSTRFSKIPRVIPLKTLLDTHSRWNDLSAANEPDMVDRELTEEQQRRKRRKRRGLRR